MRFRLAGAAAVLNLGLTTAIQGQVQQLPPGTTSPVQSSVAATPSVLQQAETRMASQDWAGALTLLKPLLVREPGNAQALYDFAFCDDALNNAEEAKSAYARAITADPQNVLSGVGLGLLLARGGDAAGAIPVLQKAVALPGDGSQGTLAAKAQALRALARLQLASSPEQSRDDLLQALRLSAETPEDVQLSGEIAEAMHDDEAATVAYARLAHASPNDAAVAVQYARVLRHQGRTDAALSAVDAALAAHPEDAPLLQEKAAALLGAKRPAEALPFLLRLHMTLPEDHAVTGLLARTYVAQGEFPQADELFQQLVRAESGSGDASAEWADSLIRQKRNVEAQALLERVLTQRFSTPAVKARAASELAFAASANHQPNVVLRAISIRSELAPLDASDAFLLAAAHDSLHQSREAAGAYRQFLALANGNYPDEEWQAKQRLETLSRAK